MYGATGEFIIEIKSLKATSVVITVNGVRVVDFGF